MGGGELGRRRGMTKGQDRAGGGKWGSGRGRWESGLGVGEGIRGSELEMEGKVGSLRRKCAGQRRNQERELGVGDRWEGEGIKRNTLGMGHEGEMIRGSELGSRDGGEIRGTRDLIRKYKEEIRELDLGAKMGWE